MSCAPATLQSLSRAADTPRGPAAAEAGRALQGAGQALQVVSIEPDGYPHSAAWAEVQETVVRGLEALGCQVTRERNRIVLPGPQAVMFGGHLLSADQAAQVPAGTVVYNLEQITGSSTWCSPAYLGLLRRCRVWDYSSRNVASLAGLGIQDVKHVPIGYVPELSRIAPSNEQDIDVLFYGSINERRAAVLEGLKQRGLAVHAVVATYGAERDALISRAKVVLNMHFYPSQIFELVRVSYLLANSKAVVAEAGPGTEIDDDIAGAVALAPYEDLVATCLSLARGSQARTSLERRGLRAMRARDETAYLAKALELGPGAPKVLAGSA